MADTSISVGTKTVQNFLDDPSLNPRAVTIVGRASVIVTVDASRGCGIILPSAKGAVLVNFTLKFGSLKTAGDPCTLALAIATKLAPKLPG